MLVDSHCHLDIQGLSEYQADKIKAAHNAGVEYLQTICTSLKNFANIQQIALDNPNIFCSVGIHPDNVTAGESCKAEDLLKLATGKKVIGIGETGLDYYRDISRKAEQQQNFREHIKAAQEIQLPVIIHSRDADDDTALILAQEMAKQKFPALIHCFTASKSFAEQVLDLGLYISLSGIITFKNAADLREAAKIIPLERLLIETDAPYLAPVPHRGKVNEPAFVKHTAEFLAEFYDVSFTEFAKITSDNFFKLFSKAAKYKEA